MAILLIERTSNQFFINIFSYFKLLLLISSFFIHLCTCLKLMPIVSNRSFTPSPSSHFLNEYGAFTVALYVFPALSIMLLSWIFCRLCWDKTVFNMSVSATRSFPFSYFLYHVLPVLGLYVLYNSSVRLLRTRNLAGHIICSLLIPWNLLCYLKATCLTHCCFSIAIYNHLKVEILT